MGRVTKEVSQLEPGDRVYLDRKSKYVAFSRDRLVVVRERPYKPEGREEAESWFFKAWELHGNDWVAITVCTRGSIEVEPG